MSVTFLGKENTPAYMALSSDISSGSIVDVSIVGATLYTTDDQAWYIISGISGSSFTLESFSLPLSQYISSIKFGTATDYTEFEEDGSMVATGSATMWNDMFFPLVSGKQGNTDEPPFDTDEVAFLFPQNDSSHIIYITAQFPHTWKTGSDISPHVHWKQTNSGSVVFKMDYKWFDIGDPVPAGWQTYVMDVDAMPYTSGSMHQLTSGSADLDGSDRTGVSSIMLIKLYRDDNTYSGAAVTYQFDIHIEIDALGSHTEYIK